MQVQEVHEITPEVIELVKEYYITEYLYFNSKLLCNFIERNNIKLTAKNISLFECYAAAGLPELKTLTKLKQVFSNLTNPKIIRTPKKNVLVFDECEVQFEDDLPIMLSWKNHFDREYSYVNDVLVSRCSSYFGVQAFTPNVESIYYYRSEDARIEYKTSSYNGIKFIVSTKIYPNGSMKRRNTDMLNKHNNQCYFFNSNLEMIKSPDEEYSIEFDEKTRTKTISSLIRTHFITTQYDERNNAIYHKKEISLGKTESNYKYTFNDNNLIYIQDDMMRLIFCIPREDINEITK